MQHPVPLVVASGPLWAPPARRYSWLLASPATVWTSVWAIRIDVGRKACLQTLGVQGEASFGHWRWNPHVARNGGAGQVAREEEVCGQEEAREQGTGYFPRTHWWHLNGPDAGSQSFGRPRCTAGRAGQHLGDRGSEKNGKREEGATEKEE